MDELRRLCRVDRTFEPEWTEDRREAAFRGWRRAVDRARDWVE
jgi:glycerol kinase